MNFLSLCLEQKVMIYSRGLYVLPNHPVLEPAVLKIYVDSLWRLNIILICKSDCKTAV